MGEETIEAPSAPSHVSPFSIVTPAIMQKVQKALAEEEKFQASVEKLKALAKTWTEKAIGKAYLPHGSTFIDRHLFSVKFYMGSGKSTNQKVECVYASLDELKATGFKTWFESRFWKGSRLCFEYQ
jgi:hypothetical protein